ncbi:ADP-ribosylation factor-like protein 4A isoform X1 [Macrobrachium rosenbergii]|uniref:ADP-ribosylation factor-like protein 4A isoform X1 n=1 Tax=Macrobrachium rosenbergii TaxID=79674 RepID=UPI0034D3A45C
MTVESWEIYSGDGLYSRHGETQVGKSTGYMGQMVNYTRQMVRDTQVPILVLANKQDLPGAREPTEIERLLGLAELANTHLWHIQPACAITGEGLDEALENLYEMIHKQRRISKTNKKKPR